VKIYLVGGAVRDKLMGIEPKDKDYVVVGATPQDMLNLGYTQVGASFPVFLSKEGEEYALARTERKTGVGYNGFAVDYNPYVTLEEDLKRRDLTINAMAMDDEGNIIDPCGGKVDLEKKILRHTGPAFAEDPVRVLRLARFRARYQEFRVHHTTLELAREVVSELNHVPFERIWTELEKGMSEDGWAHMMTTLHAAHAFDAVESLQKLFTSESMSPNFTPYEKASWAVDKSVRLDRFLPTVDHRILACFPYGHQPIDFSPYPIPNHIVRLAHVIHRVVRLCCEVDSMRTPSRKEMLQYRLTPDQRIDEMLLECFTSGRMLNDHATAKIVADVCTGLVDRLGWKYREGWQYINFTSKLIAAQRVDAGVLRQQFSDINQFKEMLKWFRMKEMSTVDESGYDEED
jgi:hypothetical protein